MRNAMEVVEKIDHTVSDLQYVGLWREQRPYLVFSTSWPVDNAVEKWIRVVGHVDSGLDWRKLAKARCAKNVLSRAAHVRDRTNEDIS